MKIPISPAFSVSFLVIFLLAACSDDKSPKDEYEDIYGIWERSGYGYALVIDENGAENYQYARETCVQAESLNNDDLQQIIDDLTVTTDNNSFSVIPSAFKVHFNRQDRLPETCETGRIIISSSPLNIFDYVWYSFNLESAVGREKGAQDIAVHGELKNLLITNNRGECFFRFARHSNRLRRLS